MRSGVSRLWAGVAIGVVVAGLVGVAIGIAGRRGHPGLVRIAAAADLRFALDEVMAGLGRERPDLDVRVAYGSSGTFYAQVLNGAPVDLFLSADSEYPRQLAARGLVIAGSEFTYAIGRLVVWVPSSSPIDVTASGMQVLLDARVAHVAIANPAHAPYGRAAESAMRHSGVYDRVKPKLVFGENVAQTLQLVEAGSADAGIVALSLAVAPSVRSRGRFWAVPLDSYPRIEQGGAILRTASELSAARDVRAYLLSDAARDILKRYGFYLPET